MSLTVNRDYLRTGAVFGLIACCLVSVGQAQTGEQGEAKQNTVNVYLWGAGIQGDLTYPIGDGSIDVSLEQIIDNLKMAGMVTYRRDIGDWSLLLDVIYLDIGNSRDGTVTLPDEAGTTVEVDASLDLKTWVGGLYAGNTFSRTATSSHRFIFGVRYLSLSADLDTYVDDPMGAPVRSGSHSATADLWDGVIGFQGQFGLGGKWRLPYHLDIGTGSSQLTYQALAGVAYELGWGDLSLTYRYLYYDEGNAGLVHELTMDGPVMAVGFRF